MTYFTSGCPHSYSAINSPAEIETIDHDGVNSLVAEFGIDESEAIEWIEGMGYDLACEELETQA